MKKRFICFVLTTLVLCSFASSEGRVVHPVYVGARVCGSCHHGQKMGHQFSRWYNSKHSKAYAVLSKPEAKKIARLSGITGEPQEAAMCLGCHATGAQAEDWEKDQTFALEDGVQCEKCHGPGSEYMDMEIMNDSKAAMRAGLMMPTKNDCLNCHRVKGSHVETLGEPHFNVIEAMKKIAHPMPGDFKTTEPVKYSRVGIGLRYVGSLKCGSCHKGPKMGYQFSKWRLSPHAAAYSVLADKAAFEMAEKKGLRTIPQKSPECLKCHTTAFHEGSPEISDTYNIDEGVGCEACHGAGSEYDSENRMKNPHEAERSGLKKVSKKTCLKCHSGYHGKSFDYKKSVKMIVHPSHLPKVAGEPQYKTPLNMAINSDRKEIYVACEASGSVIVIDSRKLKKVAEIHSGGQPHDVTFSPDGKFAYISNRLDDTVTVIETARRKVIATVPVGDEPHGLITDHEGRFLYVLNRSQNSISVIDMKTLKEVKRLTASRDPWSLAISPDGKNIVVTNNLPRFGKFRSQPMSEITVIDTEHAVVENRVVVPAANLIQGVAYHPSGKFALFTLNRTKNLVPMTRLLQGWTITNGLGILWADGDVDQVLLDEPDLCFPDPTDVAITPDGRLALVTSSGSDRVAVIDIKKMIKMLESASEYDRKNIFPNHLGKPTEFIIAHINVKNSPKGIIISQDGKTAYVANALDDSVSVIDMNSFKMVKRIDLGGPKYITKVRYGERIFHSARITFHRQFSCHTCHPDGHVNGLTFDIEPDGIGLNPVDNRSLRGIYDTAPFKWEGTNPSLHRQCGPRLAVFFTRIQPFTPEQLSALDNYICTIPRPPNRYRPVGAELTDAQRRGKRVFERMMTNDGRIIPKNKRCTTCHFPPLFTDAHRHKVNEKFWLDYEDHFDTPHLNNIYDSAPYLHNGIARTLEEIWTRYNPHDQHGVTNDMTKDQLNDLVEYIKTL